MQHVCRLRRPPGCEIYRHGDDSLSVFEVDGSVEDSTVTEYCTNLLLLAELFIAHDSLTVCATGPTMSLRYYILTRHSDAGEHLIGFFVKVFLCHCLFGAVIVGYLKTAFVFSQNTTYLAVCYLMCINSRSVVTCNVQFNLSNLMKA